MESRSIAAAPRKQPQDRGPAKIVATPQLPKPGKSGPTTTNRPTPAAGGKVFYWNPVEEVPGVCSGSAINNPSRNMVLTAAHCLINTDGVEMERWVFIPGYINGKTPYGVWRAEVAEIPTPWEQWQIWEYDVAMVTMAPLNGSELVDVVGGNGLTIKHNFPEMAIWGYPAEDPYDGKKAAYCLNMPTYEHAVLRVKAGCLMAPGASGGGWFIDFNTNTLLGMASGVTSTIIEDTGWVTSPYFGGFVQDMWNNAKNR